MKFLTEKPDGILIKIYVQPKASKTEVVGLHGDALKIRVQAPPIDGEANAAVEKFFAKLLGVSKSSVSVVKGEKSRDKTIFVRGVTSDLALAFQKHWPLK